MKRFKRLASEIAQALLAEGFTVHRYDAVKTDSVYLKLDYGACNSIRISDHAGYPHLKYRYNIGPWIESYARVEDRFPRYFWPEAASEDLVAKCKADRESKLDWYGEQGYGEIMEKKRREAKRATTGFWTHARRVKG